MIQQLLELNLYISEDCSGLLDLNEKCIEICYLINVSISVEPLQQKKSSFSNQVSGYYSERKGIDNNHNAYYIIQGALRSLDTLIHQCNVGRSVSIEDN